MTPPKERRLFALICLVLALGTMALYWPITHHPFILYDDDEYVVNNLHVTTGLSWDNFRWAFTGAHAANWHPLTWVSHQADCALFGADPGGHHLMNLLFHIANTLLVFVFLRGTTGAVWRSAMVAALFAWHPLHVESVAWASERKDVLSAFFWMLTLLAYARYAHGRLGGAPAARSRAVHVAILAFFYLLAVVFFALGLMSKPMVVTLPCVLLLLDVWPLRRISFEPGKMFPVLPALKLFAEKIPFFAMSYGGCVMTMHAQGEGGAISPMQFSIRIMNALMTYPRYISKLLWPSDLSIVYPYRYDWPLAAVTGAVVLLLVISFLAFKFIRQSPWLFAGWFWFVGTLVPTIGIIQVGAAALADRYSYLPSIGFFIVLVWSASEFCAARPRGKIILSLAGGSALLGCVLAASIQIAVWHDSVSLFLHSLEVTRDNYVTDNCLAMAFDKAGDRARALVLYKEAVRLEPRFPQSQFNLAISLIGFGDMEEGLKHLQAAAVLVPHDPDIQFDLGTYFIKHNSLTNALTCFSNVVSLRPDFPAGQYNLGSVLVNLGRPAAALPYFRESLRLNPHFAAARTELDHVLATHPELH